MKKRSFIPIASLVVLSGAAAISGTFAWFQTNRSLTLTFDDATVKSRDSNLVVEFDSSKNKDVKATKNASTQGNLSISLAGTADGKQFITDISGNGDKFYKIEQGYRKNPNTTNKLLGVSWQIPVAINDVTPRSVGANGAEDPRQEFADGYFIDFTLALSRTELTTDAGRPLAVYLGSGTKIEPVTSDSLADKKAVAGARLSVSEVNGSGDSVVLSPKRLITQNAEAANVDRWTGYKADGTTKTTLSFVNNDPLYAYMVKGTSSDTAYGFPGYKLVKADNGSPFNEVLVLDTFGTDGGLEDQVIHNATTPYQTYLATIATTTDTVKLNFRMWLEGTDADVGFDVDGNLAVDGHIKLTLDLYTLHVGE